jgi:Ca-activated chloride channel family protein
MPSDDASLQRPITLKTPDGAFIPLRDAAFEVRVDGPRVTTEVTVRFHNGTGRTVEADLVLPLPPFASVKGFQARWGQHALDGRVQGRTQAAATYAHAVSHGHAAALGEGEGEDLARLRLAPIEADAEVLVTLTILHGALATMEGHRVVVPLTYMPRYVEDAGALTPTEAAALDRARPATSEARATVRMLVRGVEPAQVRCASHKTQTAPARRGVELRIEGAALDRDVIVEVLDRPAGDAPGVSLRVCRTVGADGLGACALATVTPPAFADEGATTPRTVLFLVDRSGSMGGRPMEAARRAVRGSLRALGPDDRFNILAFDDRVEAFARTAVPFNDETLRAADAYADALDARGGTEASQALQAVMTDTPKGAATTWKGAVPADDRARLRLVVFMTDGDVAGAAGVLRAAQTALRDTRVHVLGIGDSVNHALLGEIAALGGGTYTPVSTDEDLERALTHLKNAFYAPVWTSVTARLLRQGDTLDLPALEPPTPWDLFARAPLTFAWRGALEPGDVLRLEGRAPDGSQRAVTVVLDEALDDDEAPARWAAMRARRLTYRFDAEDDAALEALGVAYGFVTRRTSLVAVDPSPSGARVEASVSVSLPMPGNVVEELERGFGGGATLTQSGMAPPGAVYAVASMAMPSPAPMGGAGGPKKKAAKGGLLGRAMQKVSDMFGGADPPEAEEAGAAMDFMSAELADDSDDSDDAPMLGAPPAPPPAPAPRARAAPAAPGGAPRREAVAPTPTFPTDDAAALRALLLQQRADGTFGDVGTTLAAVAALVSRGHTHREGDFRAELKRTLATLRGRVAGLSGDEAVWTSLAVSLLVAAHGGAPEGLSGSLEVAAQAVSLGDARSLRTAVVAALAAAPKGWDTHALAAAVRVRFFTV